MSQETLPDDINDSQPTVTTPTTAESLVANAAADEVTPGVHDEPLEESTQDVDEDSQDPRDIHEHLPEDAQEDMADAEQSSDLPTPLPNMEDVNHHHSSDSNSNARVHARSSSIASVASVGSRNVTHVAFVKSAITLIAEHKDSKKNTILLTSTKKCLEKLNNSGFESTQVFETLRLAIETKHTDVVIIALDCLSKIFTFQLFELCQVPPSKTITALMDDPDVPVQTETLVTPPPRIGLVDAAIDTIAAAFQGEGSSEQIEIQVVRALVAAVLNDSLPAHGSALLKAIRQIYNIFILSLSPMNQGVAQASLTQIVNVVFDKVEKVTAKGTPLKSVSSIDIHAHEQSQDPQPQPPLEPTDEPLKLENLKSLNDEEERLVDQSGDSGDETELIIKDGFLLFRAMCKLSVKSLENDSLDMRSHSVRSKLISLHIIHSIIKEHIDVFLSNTIMIRSTSSKDDTVFVDAVRQYLCLIISRNAASAISPVFETTLEIFWLIMSNLRYQFKREIPVFLSEIYFPIAELKTATSHQKRYFLVVAQRLCNDPRALIEFYLNYDCDSSLPNICEKLVDYLTKLALTRVEITPKQKAEYREHAQRPIATYNLSQLPMLSITKLSSQAALNDNGASYPVEYALKITSLNCIVGIMRSLNSWAQKGITPETRSSSFSNLRKRSSTNGSGTLQPLTLSTDEIDDPQEFESLKQRKTALQEGIRLFNFKAKKGIQYLLKQGFIQDNDPTTIAKFLLNQPGLDKSVIGEYMGEGDDDHIAIMHAFVDLMDFTNLKFVEAMRRFLQSFRLPGEAQKIDRYMLKFAERYVDGNPGVFANADTAYVLAYSVIMLNTDQHSKNVKNRMTTDDFLKNNSGIDNEQNLPDEMLIEIFDEIVKDEIKLQSEQHAALLSGDLAPSQPQGFAIFSGRDVNREAYIQASKEISNKTEKLFKSLDRSGKTVFYSASHIEHVKSIFDNLWMSFLAALTTPFKAEDDEDTVAVCLDGLKLAISICCTFELDYARTSFIGALVQFSSLSNVKELKNKNVDAILLMLKSAEQHGNQMKNSWKDILTTASQTERLQLIAKGIQADVVPDVANARVHRTSLESARSHQTAPGGFFFGLGKKATPTEQAQLNHHDQRLDPIIGQRLTSSEISVAIDKIFTQSSQLNGIAIVDFIKALTEVASEEIESSSDSNTPRTFSLQKVIDVCHYNMGRIRVEYTSIWNVISDFFKKIINKDHNLSVIFFALDSLRQLSMRFMDIEELAGFKFQEDFLKPFDYILKHANGIDVTEMILNCLNNLIQLKGSKIKSGWKTIFSALKYTASDSNQTVVKKTYDIIDSVYKDHSETILGQEDTFGEMVGVLAALSRNSKFQKIGLQSLSKTKQIITRVAELTLGAKKDDPILKHHKDLFKDLWYPGLSSLNEVIMTAEDLEVRSRALNYMFDVLVQFGSRFTPEFWDKICVELLFPIFGVLSKHWEINQFNSHDDMSVWLSTTLIQALRNMIALFTHYFDTLSRMLDGYLGLLISCICQENDTIARIGRSCFQQLITQNMEKFTQEHWDKISDAFEKLFELTTVNELFDADPLKHESTIGESPSSVALNEAEGVDVGNSVNGDSNGKMVRTKSTDELRAKAKSKNAIVIKCILQLLMIETVSELFEEESFYELIPYENLMKLSGLLEQSFRFSRKFNDDYNLRVRLWKSGIIDRLPNLLKQESSSAAVFIGVTFRVYSDAKKITPKQKDAISTSLIPMCVSIVERYTQLDDSQQQRNVTTWRPVVVEILQGYCELEERDFVKNCPHVYDLMLNILDKSVPSELRTALKAFFGRVGDVYIREEK